MSVVHTDTPADDVEVLVADLDAWVEDPLTSSGDAAAGQAGDVEPDLPTSRAASNTDLHPLWLNPRDTGITLLQPLREFCGCPQVPQRTLYVRSFEGQGRSIGHRSARSPDDHVQCFSDEPPSADKDQPRTSPGV